MQEDRENSKLSLDLSYQSNEDRLHLNLRINGQSMEWWLTRKMTLALIMHWAEKLLDIGLPQIQVEGIAGLKRDLGLEHALSLEYDGPEKKDVNFTLVKDARLVKEIVLSVTELESVLAFKAEQKKSELRLTRKESHSLLEMIASQAKVAGWLTVPDLPNWLGISN